MGKDKLTNQDKKFVKEIVETGNQTQSAKKAYGIKTDEYAGKKGSLKVREGKIKQAIQNIADAFTNDEIVQKHKELLNSSRVDHMVFPLGPKTNAEKEDYYNKEREKATKKGELYGDIDYLSDEDIEELLSEVNCKMRKVVHGETGRHVYFWSADNMARDKALDKVYKIKGTYAPEEHNVKFGAFTKEQLIDKMLEDVE